MSDEFVLVLRTCDANLRSHNGFQWPESGYVEAPDWRPTYKCGHGLHGLPWGEGDGRLLNWGDDAKWLVVRVKAKDLLAGQGDLTDKCKFKGGEVVYCGDRLGATQYITENGGAGKAIVGADQQTDKDGATQTAGDGATQTAGYRATQTAGYRATQTAGYGATQTAGDRATQTAGDRATQTAGYRATQTAGYGATQTAGYGATQTAGDRATQTAGYGATQTAGYGATQTAGDGATQTAGYGATQTAGDGASVTCGQRSRVKAGAGSCVLLRFYSWDDHRWHITAHPVSDGGLKPNTWYEFNEDDQPVEISDPKQEDERVSS
jgi:hypothetical protein